MLIIFCKWSRDSFKLLWPKRPPALFPVYSSRDALRQHISDSNHLLFLFFHVFFFAPPQKKKAKTTLAAITVFNVICFFQNKQT